MNNILPRLIILTSVPPFYSAEFIQKLIDEEVTNQFNIEIWLFSNKKSIWQKSTIFWKQIKKSGLEYVIKKIIYFLKYKNACRQNKSGFKCLQKLTENSLLSFHEFSNFDEINNISTEDMLLSLYFDVIIPEFCLNRFNKKINLHPSLIPAYKGTSPVFWVLAKSEKYTGYTFHELSPKLDDGKILYQETIKIENNDTFHSLYSKISIHAASSFVDFIHQNKFPNFDLANTKSSYFSIPTKAAFIRFKHQKRKFI